MNAFRDGIRQDSSIDAESREQVIREVDRAYEHEPPPTLAFIGEAGVGKSTTVNSLFNAGQEVGHFRPTTLAVEGFEVYATVDHIRGSRGDLRVIDMPGVGDDVANYESYLRLYLETLPRADAILWVHPAPDRMVAFMQQVLHDLVRHAPDLRERIVFGLNKADEMGPGNWNPHSNTPSSDQVRNLEERVKEFTRSIKPHVNTRKPAVVAYSALRRYNLATLFRTVMEAVPKPRRWVLESRMDLANFIDLVDRGLLHAAASMRGPAPTAPGAAPVAAQPTRVTFDEYLDSLGEAEYRALVADRARFKAVRDDWGKHA
ncbi:GTPase [Actinoplanes sp. NPDC051861]|uniref:GTPase family protein n=1 Tax=Actinoplanes sp. NPDC051861 TaxID=3155170 RepID=UPI00342891DE